MSHFHLHLHLYPFPVSLIVSLSGRVTDIEKLSEIVDDYLFQLVIDNLHSVRARRVILATGIQDGFDGYPKGIQGGTRREGGRQVGRKEGREGGSTPQGKEEGDGHTCTE